MCCIAKPHHWMTNAESCLQRLLVGNFKEKALLIMLTTFDNTLTAIWRGSQLKRARDYRNALNELTITLKNGKIEDCFFKILRSLCEIQDIMYSRERSPQLIFRLYNLVFMHIIYIKEAFDTIKKRTTRKFHGQYMHELIEGCHQFRIMSLPSANVEEEEQMFKFLKHAATWTSNHHPENVLDNAFVRMQVRDDYADQKNLYVICSMMEVLFFFL